MRRRARALHARDQVRERRREDFSIKTVQNFATAECALLRAYASICWARHAKGFQEELKASELEDR